ncbi:MAG: hypothetical protein PHZ02_14235 [Desulfocapsaceae bacterium]|nr:hypothetical protein [Desulfocapsaceae bacterium]
MGEAKRKGTYDERRKNAIKRNKELLSEQLGGRDERLIASLRMGLDPFFKRMTKDQWKERRQKLLDYLKSLPENVGLEKAKPIRVQADEIGWYLFLCEQTINDPMCVDVSQQQRILPFFSGIGERWVYAPLVQGLERKIDDLLFKNSTEPDGLIFEILVALSYAEKGWAVEFIEEGPKKTPDIVARKNGKELYIECKRLARRTKYAEQERTEFFRLWDAAKEALIANRQWVWMKGIFHTEASTLPNDFLTNIYSSNFPIGEGETLIHDDANATIYARLIDIPSVRQHMSKFRVKLNSPSFSRLLGGNWAPMNSAVTVINAVKVGHVVDCEVPALGAYVEEVGWASGFTREFDSEVSIHKKARDILTRLADAVKQLPDDKPSVVHIAAETLEGKDVEKRRTEKVMNSVKKFTTDKPLLGIRFHRFQANQCVDKLYEFDETVERFQVDGVNLEDIPENVVTPNDAILREDAHWEIYS